MNVGHPIRAGVITLAIAGLAYGGYWISRFDTVDLGDCGEWDVPVLAASGDLDIATSCVAPPDFSYNGVEYELLCETVPESHVGPWLHTGGGETTFEGARAIIGMPSDHGLIVEGDICENRTAVGLSNDLTDEEWKRLRGWGDGKKEKG